MGGKLWNLPRMPRDSYLAREAEVRACLDRLLPGRYRIPRAYGDKPDFGDMDILVAPVDERDPSPRDVVAAGVLDALGITETRSVGHVLSTVYRGLQTDFFAVPTRYLDSTYAFMCWNDAGNLIGRICRRFDLTFGEHGLSYVFRRSTDDQYRADLEVTRDFARTCAFLGLDHAAWLRGFATLDEVFAWIVASPSFTVAPYLDDPKGHLRRRADERGTVARFIQYLRDRGIDQRPAFDERSAYLPRIIEAFPEADLAGQIAREHDAEARHARFVARFSGKKVMRLVPGVEGKALGELIVRFKASIGDADAFEAWVLATPEHEIDQRIVAFARDA
jgi:hypothetical protein